MNSKDKIKLIIQIMRAINATTKSEHFTILTQDEDEIQFTTRTSVSVMLEYATDIARLLNVTLHVESKDNFSFLV